MICLLIIGIVVMLAIVCALCLTCNSQRNDYEGPLVPVPSHITYFFHVVLYLLSYLSLLWILPLICLIFYVVVGFLKYCWTSW